MKTTLALILTLALWGCSAEEVTEATPDAAPEAAKVETHEGHDHAAQEHADHEGHDHAAHADHEGHDHAEHGEEGCEGHEDGKPCDCDKEGHEGDHANCAHHQDEGAEPAAGEAEGTEAAE